MALNEAASSATSAGPTSGARAAEVPRGELVGGVPHPLEVEHDVAGQQDRPDD